MDKIVLEAICQEIDGKFSTGKEINTESLKDYLGGLGSDGYREFAVEYIQISSNYHEKIDNLRERNNIGNMDLERVGWNTLLGGFAGLSTSPYLENESYTVIGAATGAGLTIADELLGLGIDFEYAFWGTVVGGFIGGFYEYGLIGAAVGGGLGLLKGCADAFSYNKNQERKLKSKSRKAESKFIDNREKLIEKTLNKYEDNSNVNRIVKKEKITT